MISTELDLAKKLFSFAGMASAASDDAATSVRIGTVTQINADGSISVRLADTGETVYLEPRRPSRSAIRSASSSRAAFTLSMRLTRCPSKSASRSKS